MNEYTLTIDTEKHLAQLHSIATNEKAVEAYQYARECKACVDAQIYILQQFGQSEYDIEYMFGYLFPEWVLWAWRFMPKYRKHITPSRLWYCIGKDQPKAYCYIPGLLSLRNFCCIYGTRKLWDITIKFIQNRGRAVK